MKYVKEHQLLAAVVPQWHYRIARPFKQFRESGITPEAYHCLQVLLWQGDGMTMSELAGLARMSRQQADYYETMFEEMGEEDRLAFGAALEVLNGVFSRLPNPCCCRSEEEKEEKEGKEGRKC